MSFTFTFQLQLTCFQCGQIITTQDLAQGNCQFIFPENIGQHKVCPIKPPCHLKECGWTKPLNSY